MRVTQADLVFGTVPTYGTGSRNISKQGCGRASPPICEANTALIVPETTFCLGAILWARVLVALDHALA